MAKVDTIKLDIDGELYTYNINVGKSGIFKCNLDFHVAQRLGIDPSQVSDKLVKVKDTIMSAYKDYMEATKVQEPYIAIRYQANGSYRWKVGGKEPIFPNYGSPYNLHSSSSAPDCLGFDFKVYIKETSSSGNEGWYNAYFDDTGKLRKKRSHFCFSRPTDCKIIPYTEEAYKTLSKARDGIRTISEILFNFMEQDENAMIESLIKGNLLENSK